MKNKKENITYTRSAREKVSDFFYGIKIKIFKPKNGGAANKPSKRKLAETLFIISILAIPVAHFLIFWLYVHFDQFVMAFQTGTGAEVKWSFKNFEDFWFQLTKPNGNNIGLSLLNTFKYFAQDLFLIFPLTLVISYFIYKKIPGYKIFRIILFLPSIISSVVTTTVFAKFIDSKGPLGYIAEIMGFELPYGGLLNNTATATPTILAYSFWLGLTGNVILFSSTMSRVPTEVLEAAKLDGCSLLREFVQIILPLVWPTISTMIIFKLTGLLSASGPILLFKSGGENETSTLSFWIFSQVYGSGGAQGSLGDYGLVSCAGLCFTAVCVPFMLVVRWLFDKIPAVEY